MTGALAKQRLLQQDPDDWKHSVEKRLKPTTLSLRSYGGSDVNLVREIRVTLKRANHVTDAIVQVHAGAPVDLLLGTDVQPRLGFMFFTISTGGSAEELIQGGKWLCDRTTPSPDAAVSLPPMPQPPNTTVTVSLLQATHLPARFAKTVRAKVSTQT